MRPPLPVFPVDRVTARLSGASSSPVLVETSSGRFVAKLTGAGHGASALIAEIAVAELAENLGLPVPERVLLQVPAAVPSDDGRDELRDLLDRSVGLNLGLRLLEGARVPRSDELARLELDFKARVLWLDGLVMNPDRTKANPNLLLWKNQPWLIDHGSAFLFQHDLSRVTEASPRDGWDYGTHVFGDALAAVRSVDSALAPLLTRSALERSLARVPDDFLGSASEVETPARLRALYTAFLWKRLKPPRPFTA